MRYRYAWITLALCLSRCLRASSQAPDYPFAVTVDGDFGRPVATAGFSGRMATGVGGALELEYRGWDRLGVGVSFNDLVVSQDAFSEGMQSLDLFARLVPFGRATCEPYALLGLGSVVAASANDAARVRDAAPHANLALGLLYSIDPMWAVDGALSYQVMGPSGDSLIYLDARIGLQARFGADSPARDGQIQAPPSK